MTSVFAFVCSTRLASAATCIEKNFMARFVPFVRVARHEGEPIHRAFEVFAPPPAAGYRHDARSRASECVGPGERRLVGEGSQTPAFTVQLEDIEIREQEFVFSGKALGFAQHHAVLGRDAVTGKHDIRGRFGRPRSRVEVSRDAAARLVRDEVSSIIGLTDDFRGSRSVQKHCRAAERL